MTPPQLRVPELVPGLDIRALPLSALEGFVLSRIDGRASVLDVVTLTGLGQEQVLEILQKLVNLGAVRYVGSNAAMSGRPLPGRSQSSGRFPSVLTSSEQPPNATTSDRPQGGSATRRRPLYSTPPRRMMSESGVSQPPPDVRRSHPPSASRPAPATRSTPPGLMDRPTGKPVEPQRPRVPRKETPQIEMGDFPEQPTSSLVQPGFDRPTTTAHKPIPRGDEPMDSSTERVVFREPRQRAADGERTNPRVQVDKDAARELFARGAADDRDGTPRIDKPAGTAPNNAIPPGPPSKPDLLSELIGSAKYDPRELLEDVELPIERRRQVLDLFYRIQDLDFYEALGIDYDADKKEVRAAYFALSKVFHPDTMFRKNLGSFKAKMEACFKALTEAYDVLSKKKSREEYDAYLRATKKTQMAERTVRRQAEEAAREAAEAAREAIEAAEQQAQTGPGASSGSVPGLPPRPSMFPPAGSPVPSAAPAPPREISDEARRLAQQVLQRRLRGVIGNPPAAARPPSSESVQEKAASAPPPDAPTTRTDPQEILRRLAKTLKDVGQVTGSNDKLTRHVKASQAAFARGDLSEALQQMRRAVSIAPDRPDLQVEHDRISRLLSEKLSTDYAAQAAYETKAGKWASAALSWGKVCEGKPTDPVAHRNAAACMLKAGADLRGAQKYAQQAVFLAQNDIDNRLLLAQIYLTIGLKLNAKRELDAAAKLDPNHEMLKNLLGDLNS